MCCRIHLLDRICCFKRLMYPACPGFILLLFKLNCGAAYLNISKSGLVGQKRVCLPYAQITQLNQGLLLLKLVALLCLSQAQTRRSCLLSLVSIGFSLAQWISSSKLAGNLPHNKMNNLIFSSHLRDQRCGDRSMSGKKGEARSLFNARQLLDYY